MTSFQPRILAGSALLLAALTLAGCTTATPSADPTTATSATPDAAETIAPSVTPTPTATPVATRPKLAELVVSPAGVGPILIGEKVKSEPKTVAVAVWGKTACVADGYVNAEGERRKLGDPYAGKWVVQYPDTSNLAGSDRAPFEIQVRPGFKTGTVSAVFVWSPKLTTAEGIHVGSTLAELKAAYPTFTSVLKGKLSDVYVIDSGKGRLGIEVGKNNNMPGYWPKSQVGRVAWMTAFSSTVKPFALTGLDGAGSC